MKVNEMVKHTPGPWHLAYGGQDADDYAIIGSKFSERAICNMEPRDYVQANARLIAAAPELLEACKKFVNKQGVMTWDEYESAKAAIAKAEGRE